MRVEMVQWAKKANETMGNTSEERDPLPSSQPSCCSAVTRLNFPDEAPASIDPKVLAKIEKIRAEAEG